MVALNKPARRDYNSVESYIFDKQPLVDEENGFIYNKEDLITLRDGREMALLDSFIETLLKVFHCPLLQVILPKPSLNQTLLLIKIVENILFKGMAKLE